MQQRTQTISPYRENLNQVEKEFIRLTNDIRQFILMYFTIYPFTTIAVGTVLGVFLVFYVNATLPIWIGCFIIWIFLGLVHTILYVLQWKRFLKNIENLLIHNHPDSACLFLQMIHSPFVPQSTKKRFYEALSTLLYNMEDCNITHFTVDDLLCLRKLARSRSAARHYPDAVAGALVTLRLFGDAANKAVVEEVAKRVPQKKSEEWLPEAAQACLIAWDSKK
jgi:hypothetical protein